MKSVNYQGAHDVLFGPPGLFFFSSIAVPLILIMLRVL